MISTIDSFVHLQIGPRTAWRSFLIFLFLTLFSFLLVTFHNRHHSLWSSLASCPQQTTSLPNKHTKFWHQTWFPTGLLPGSSLSLWVRPLLPSFLTPVVLMILCVVPNVSSATPASTYPQNFRLILTAWQNYPLKWPTEIQVHQKDWTYCPS